MINVLIVEDQVMLRDSLTKVFSDTKDIRVAGVSADANEAVEMARKLAPDIVLLDVILDNKTSGIDAAAHIKKAAAKTRIIIMTALPEITFLRAAKKAGADSFIYKNISSENLIGVIHNTMDGYSIYPANPPTKLPFNPDFTDVEIAILHQICLGKGRPEIAKEVGVSESSLKTIIRGICDKTGSDNIVQFAFYAAVNGFIVPEL
jgi:DNA-binding NarL/FixJ family response regulator